LPYAHAGAVHAPSSRRARHLAHESEKELDSRPV